MKLEVKPEAKPLLLITGAAQRIGRAIATHFAGQGWQVAVHYHRSTAAAQALADFYPNHMVLFQQDLAAPEAGKHLLAQVIARCGIPTVLINNAAQFEPDAADAATNRLHRASHAAVNFTAPVALTQSLYQAVAAHQAAPRVVINLLDNQLHAAMPHFANYAASKAALEAWTLAQAPQLHPWVQLYGLKLSATLMHPRQSPAHFAKLAAASPSGQPTTLPQLLAAIAARLAGTAQPVIAGL